MTKHESIPKHEKTTQGHLVRMEGTAKWIAVMLISKRRAGAMPRLSALLRVMILQVVMGSAVI
jgi:hypothetical protein